MPSTIVTLGKRLARVVFGEYAIYRLLSLDSRANKVGQHELPGATFEGVAAEDIARSNAQEIRDQAWYAGEGCRAYGCRLNGELVAVCFYWFGDRYRQRGFIQLGVSEAKLVQIITVPSMRGLGIAPLLIARSAEEMLGSGFTRLLARVWFSNTPSLRAFERAGWRRHGWVFEVNPLRRKSSFRVRV